MHICTICLGNLLIAITINNENVKCIPLCYPFILISVVGWKQIFLPKKVNFDDMFTYFVHNSFNVHFFRSFFLLHSVLF